jgi:hypothetical protein
MKNALSLTVTVNLLAACSSTALLSPLPATHTTPPPGAVDPQTTPISAIDAGSFAADALYEDEGSLAAAALYGDYGSDASPYDGSLIQKWLRNDSGTLGCPAPDPASIASVLGCKQIPLPAGLCYYDPNHVDAGIFTSQGIPITRPIGTCPASTYVVHCDNAYGGPSIWINGPPTNLGCVGMVEDFYGDNFCCPCR